MAPPSSPPTATTPFGVSITFVAAVLWALNSLGYYISVKAFSKWMVCFATSLVYIPSVGFIQWEYGQKYRPLDTMLIVAAGTFDLIGLVFRVIGFSLLTVGNASAIIYSKPVICSILTKLFLNDKFGMYDCGIVIANLIGVILVSKPGIIFGSDPSEDKGKVYLGSLACLLSAVFGSMHLIAIRKLSERETSDPATILFVKTVLGFAVFGLVLIVNLGENEVRKSLADWCMLGVTCFAALFACALLYMALRTESTTVVASIGTTEVIVAYLFQVTFTTDVLDWIAVMGALLIILAPVWYLLKSVIVPIARENQLI